MKLMHLTKKKAIAFGLVLGVTAGVSGVAAAYFSASGSGSGSASVGSPTPFTVTQTGSASSALGPTGTSTLTFKVANTAAYKEHYDITATDASIVASTTATHTTTIASTSSGTGYVAGCKVSWFTATATAKTGTLAKSGTTGDTTTDLVTIHMTTTPTTTQAVCSTHTPFVKLSFLS